MPRQDVDLFALLCTLATGGVDFIVTGGVGAVLQGAPIATFDLDLVHSRDPGNTDRLAAALATLGAYYREHPEGRHVPDPIHLSGPGHHLLMTNAGPLDLLGAVTGGCGYQDLVGHTVDLEIEPGLIIKVLDLATIAQGMPPESRRHSRHGAHNDLCSPTTRTMCRRFLRETARAGRF